MVMALAIAYTFSSEYFPGKSEAYYKHKKTYTKIIKERDLAIRSALKGTSIESNVLDIINTSDLKLQNYNKKKLILIKQDSFLGYTSLKTFALSTSLSVLSLIISLILLYVIVIYIKDKKSKYFWLLLSFVLVATTGYWVSWSFLHFSLNPKRPFDFPRSVYNFCIYVLPTLVFIISYFLMRYKKTIEIKLKNIINVFSKIAILDAPKFMSKTKLPEYKKHYIKEMEKGTYN